MLLPPRRPIGIRIRQVGTNVDIGLEHIGPSTSPMAVSHPLTGWSDRCSRANVATDWIKRRLWLQWDHPTNSIPGESQYQDVIAKLPGVKPGLIDEVRLEPVEVELIREPDNPHDRLACRAVVVGSLIGYLSRECASVLTPQVDATGAHLWC
jgi:hypothetical protein